jgi:hypothetical protein
MRIRTASLAVVALTIALAGTLLASARGATDPARNRSCGWILEPSADRENILFPDTGTRYLGALVPVPPGGYLEITGQFPHARYMSLQAYSTLLQTTSDLRDTQIVPDPGSTNPFLPGADRNATHRNYTVKIVSGKPPANPPPNTLYDASADGSKSGHAFAYRIYLPDRSAGPFGGVPAPSITIVLPGGIRLPLPTCQDPLTDVGVTQALAGLGLANYGLPTSGLLAVKTPHWTKYVNAPTSYINGVTDNQYTPPQLQAVLGNVAGLLPSGLGENADNKYVYSYLSQEFGQVVAFRARLPTTPHTYDGEPAMASGQLRYWSMCTGTRTTQTLGCTVDEQTPVDSNGYFTIAISPAADRPADASNQCGVAWLPWGPDPKGIALMRNMLPSPDFAQAIQNAAVGSEQKTMGAYYPTGTYYSTPEAFDQAVGCHAPAGSKTPGSPGRCVPPRVLHIKLATGHGAIRKVGVYVGGHRVKTVRGRHLRSVTLRRPKHAKFTVRVVAVTAHHQRITRIWRYSGCARKRVRWR